MSAQLQPSPLPAAPPPGTLLKALQGSNVALRSGPAGTLQASADTLELRQIAVQTPFGTADVAQATLRDVLVQLAPGAAGALVLRGLRAASLDVGTAEIVPSFASATPAEPLRLEPLGTLQGRLTVSIRDARWVIDAEITVPVVAGRIDFDRVVVEHVGPNSAMGVAQGGIYVEAPSRGRTELVRFVQPQLPGVRYEQHGGFMGMQVSDRGSLDLRAFVEALLNAGANAPVSRPAGGDMGLLLRRTRLAGDLQLADGAIGTSRASVVLADRAQGRNGVALDAAVLGQRLVARIPQLFASRATFQWQGRAGATGPIAASVEAHVTGLEGAAPAVALKLQRMTVRDVQLGYLQHS